MPDVSYDVDRVGVPNWVLDQHFSSPGDDDLGGQVAWHFATPWAFRALASPRTGERLLRAPNQDDPHEHRLAYWTSLLYLLTYRLGWARLDRGLKWWFDGGADGDDPTVRLIAETWGRDGALGQLAQWVHKDNDRLFTDIFADLCGYIDRSGAHAHLPIGPRVEYEWPDGPAQLHLEGGFHLAGGFDAVRTNSYLLTSDAKQARAVLVYPSMMGWYRALAEHGATLRDIGARSWRVDVVVRPVGLLGTYRRSRETGIWFAGRHSAHAAGT